MDPLECTGMSVSTLTPFEVHILSPYRTCAGCRCALPLASGSLLVLDNLQVMHGRLPYKGNQRKMIAVLTSD